MHVEDPVFIRPECPGAQLFHIPSEQNEIDPMLEECSLDSGIEIGWVRMGSPTQMGLSDPVIPGALKGP